MIIMFTSFLFEKLSHLKQFYGTETEFVHHLMSGEVTMSIPQLTDYQSEYENKQKFLPTKFQLSERVDVRVKNGFYLDAKIVKVHLAKGHHASYDVDYDPDSGYSESCSAGPDIEVDGVNTENIKVARLRLYNLSETMLSKAVVDRAK